MAVDAQWASVVVMMPLSADFLDARGNVTIFGTLTEILDTVGSPFGAGDAAFFGGSASGPNYSGGSVDGYVNLSTDFSIQLAFRTEDGGHGGADAVLIQIGETGAAGTMRIICNASSNPAQLRVQCDSGAGYVDLIGFVATDVSDDTWHWLQLDRITHTFYLWLDGVQYSTATMAVAMGGNGVYLGQDGQSQNLYKGWMAQLRITVADYRASHAVPTDPWPRPTISGTVLDLAGLPIRRLIRVIPRAQGVHVLSDLVTGQYTAYPTTYDEQIVLRIDTDTDPPVDGVGVENCLVYDRVTPGS
jgi:hypothetical protein